MWVVIWALEKWDLLHGILWTFRNQFGNYCKMYEKLERKKVEKSKKFEYISSKLCSRILRNSTLKFDSIFQEFDVFRLEFRGIQAQNSRTQLRICILLPVRIFARFLTRAFSGYFELAKHFGTFFHRNLAVSHFSLNVTSYRSMCSVCDNYWKNHDLGLFLDKKCACHTRGGQLYSVLVTGFRLVLRTRHNPATRVETYYCPVDHYLYIAHFCAFLIE